MMEINDFFNQLRIDAGAIWLENENIKLSTSAKLRNDTTRDFVIDNKKQITAVLSDNNIFSKDAFWKTLIIKNTLSKTFPLSPAQERIWFIEQYEQGSNAYHIPAVYELGTRTTIKGIKHALQQIVTRHEVLRTTIEQCHNQEQGIQRVHEEPLQMEEVTVSNQAAYRSLIKEDVNRPFDLSKEYPVRVKFYIVKQTNALTGLPSKKKVFLLINIHHIAADGWSIGIFEKELLAFYQAFVSKDNNFCLPGLDIQYKDYAVWQKTFLTGQVLESQLGYWKKKLAGYQALQLPTDFVRPGSIDYKGAQEKFTFTKAISGQLRNLARINGATLHSVMLSSIYILLGKYSGQDDIVVGSPIANRQHLQTEGLMGCFVNMQVNRARLNKTAGFQDLIQEVHQEQAAAQLYQDLPFEKLVDELGVNGDPSRHPIFQVMFVVQRFGNKKNNSFKASPAKGVHAVEKFDLSFYIDDHGEELTGQISYATSLFHKNSIVRLIDHYAFLLYQLIASPLQPYGLISLLNPEEYKQTVTGWNKTNKTFPVEKTICQLFQEQVDKWPDNIALDYESERLTYRELNEQSNHLAQYIRKQYTKRTKHAIPPGIPIAIFTDNSIEAVTGILAILKAGAAFVPVATHYPQERINYILEDTGTVLILCQRKAGTDKHLLLPQEKIIHIWPATSFHYRKELRNLPLHNTATGTAYIIYTSGTTGKPKGVQVTHSNLVNLIFAQKKLLSIKPASRVLQYASLPFDASVWEIFSALCTGAQLCILPAHIRQEAQLLSRYLDDAEISTALLPPAMLSAIHHAPLPHLKTLLVGGEVCDTETMNRWSRNRKLINAYGPTESTVIACMHTYKTGDKNNCIGKPLTNCKAYVLDSNLAPVPVGIVGELHIGGAGVAGGYLNKPNLTEESFIPSPFATNADRVKGYTRLYKTGDLVRWLPDGCLEYRGRNDEQVKIRGFRIETGEIETALLQIKGIRQCCVAVKERQTVSGAGKYLAAYFTTDGCNEKLAIPAIEKKLSQLLPAYMLPERLLEIDAIPLTSNGKLDTQALPNPGFGKVSNEYSPPVNATEIALCNIWQKVLGINKAGMTDNFFILGGNSILAIEASYRMSQLLGYTIKVADIFRLKSIDKIVGANDHAELVKPFHTTKNISPHNMIFIHPGHSGAEAYQQLADLLCHGFNCIGIDNYNMYQTSKVFSLHKLAHYYLAAYEKKYALTHPVYLLGWSLGGQLALEMAGILEQRGYTNIHLFLLDTYISNDSSNAKKGKYPPVTKKKPDSLEADDIFETARQLAASPISHYLCHTQVVLFKAKQKKHRINNNIESAAKHVTSIPLHCNHLDIIRTNSATISNYILSARHKMNMDE